jgi:hypothetical protein
LASFWALLTPRAILTFGLDWDSFHVVNNCKQL